MSTLPISAEEMVEIVEDQLAWLAVLDSSKVTFVNHFDMCVPWVNYAGHKMIVDGTQMEVGEKVDVEPRALRQVGVNLLPSLGRGLRYSEMRQCDPLIDTESRVRKEPDPGVEWSITSVSICSQKEKSILIPEKNIHKFHSRVRHDRLVIVQEVMARRDGATVFGSDVASISNDGRLYDIYSGLSLEFVSKAHGGGELMSIEERVYVGAFEQSTRDSVWNVRLSLTPERTGICVATDMIGCRDLVKAIELDGANRRSRKAALVHWVKEHYRVSRPGFDPSFVRSHLRGKQAVDLGGMFAKIYPSRQDIDRACNGKRFDMVTT